MGAHSLVEPDVQRVGDVDTSGRGHLERARDGRARKTPLGVVRRWGRRCWVPGFVGRSMRVVPTPFTDEDVVDVDEIAHRDHPREDGLGSNVRQTDGMALTDAAPRRSEAGLTEVWPRNRPTRGRTGSGPEEGRSTGSGSAPRGRACRRRRTARVEWVAVGAAVRKCLGCSSLGGRRRRRRRSGCRRRRGGVRARWASPRRRRGFAARREQSGRHHQQRDRRKSTHASAVAVRHLSCRRRGHEFRVRHGVPGSCDVKIASSKVAESSVPLFVPGPPPVTEIVFTSVRRGRL